MAKYISVLIVLTFIEIALAGYLTFWREHFWNAIANKDIHHFFTQILIFTIVALICCVVAGLSSYLLNLASIEWRKNLNAKAIKASVTALNFEQRVQEDCKLYPDLMLNLIFGSLKSFVYVVVFAIILLIDFSWWILGVLVLYSIIGTTIAHKIAAILLNLNYNSQNYEASYRKKISDGFLTDKTFDKCIELMFGIARKQKHLTYFQSFYSQLGIIFPILLIAPLYFTTGMSFGLLMRFYSTTMTILENTSFGINSYAIINNMRASRNRLKEIGVL